MNDYTDVLSIMSIKTNDLMNEYIRSSTMSCGHDKVS